MATIPIFGPGRPGHGLPDIGTALEVVGHEGRVEEFVLVVDEAVDDFRLVAVGRDAEEADLPLLPEADQGLPCLGMVQAVRIGDAVELDDVDVVGAQGLQAGLDVVRDRLSRFRGRLRLRGDIDLVAQAFKSPGDDLLVPSAHVAPRRIDVVDAVLEGHADHFRLGCQHGPEAHDRDFQPRPAERPVDGLRKDEVRRLRVGEAVGQ